MVPQRGCRRPQQKMGVGQAGETGCALARELLRRAAHVDVDGHAELRDRADRQCQPLCQGTAMPRHLDLVFRHRRRLDQREHVLLLDPPAGACPPNGGQVDTVLLRELPGDRDDLLLRRRRHPWDLDGGDLLARLADVPEHLADADDLVRAVQNGEQGPRDGGLDLEGRLVGLDLEQRLALRHGRADLLEPPDDPQLVLGRPERRHADGTRHQP